MYGYIAQLVRASDGNTDCFLPLHCMCVEFLLLDVMWLTSSDAGVEEVLLINSVFT